MKWSFLLGNFGGTEIRLHASLLLLIPYALLTFNTGSFRDLLYILLLITAIFVCVAFHEMGHTLAARMFGIEVKSIVLWPLGGFANLSRRPESVWQDLLISAAGPFTNFLIFLFVGALTLIVQLVSLTQLLPLDLLIIATNRVFPFLAGLTFANLGLALFNLVPVYPLDGGQITRGLLKLLFGERRADLILIVLSLPLALGLTVLGVVMRDVIVLLTGLLMILAVLTLNVRVTNSLTLAIVYFLDRPGYYLKRSNFDRAIDEYTRAIQRSPQRSGLYISRAVAYMSVSDMAAAKADIEQALLLDSKSALAWALSGEILALEKRYDQALAAYNRAIELKPGWGIAHLDRGSLYQDLGRPLQAMEDMNLAVEFGQGVPVTYLLRSKLRFQLGDISGARADADQALRFGPQWMLTFTELFLENFQGHLEWALDYYALAIQRMPRAYQAYQGRADACRINQKLDWALADYARAIELAPQQAELYLNRGRTYLMLNQPEAAAEDFLQASRLAKLAHVRRQAQELLNQAKPGAALAATAPGG